MYVCVCVCMDVCMWLWIRIVCTFSSVPVVVDVVVCSSSDIKVISISCITPNIICLFFFTAAGMVAFCCWINYSER